MKIEKYELMIDRMIEASIIFSWYSLFFVISLFCLTIITIIIILSFFNSVVFYNIFFYGILPFSTLATIPITIMLYYTRKAKKIYRHHSETIRLRDFWMGFATIIQLNTRGSDKNNINKWLKENISHMHKELNSENCYVFASKSDAMAFKLAWY